MRLASGIKGLDEIIGGGIPENFVMLVTGEIGTGKTIFGLQFLCTAKEPGVFVSFEEDIDRLRETAKIFGWDTERMEREKKLRIIKIEPYRFEDVLDVMENSMREIKARRVVIDSISTLGIHILEISELRNTMVQIGDIIRKNKFTALLISEMPHQGALSRFGVEEFVADGVVVLQKAPVGNEYLSMLSVYKMRSSDHSKKIHTYNITNEGIVLRGTAEEGK